MIRSRGERSLSIIVPTYNEAENIPELLNRIEGTLRGESFEIIVVDDNSRDGTADLVEELGEKYGNVRVLRRPGRLGLGSAVVDGVEVADGDMIAVMDADLQHPPELLPRMLEKADEGSDVVVASRYVKGGGVERWGVLRRLISLGAISLAHLLFPRTRAVKDPVSGFFLFRKSVVDGVRLNPLGFKILIEILVKGEYHKVAEVPYIFRSRRKGRSKLDLREIFNYAIFLLRLRVGR
jgi:dolichol-phosphate mannosyltransferase